MTEDDDTLPASSPSTEESVANAPELVPDATQDMSQDELEEDSIFVSHQNDKISDPEEPNKIKFPEDKIDMRGERQEDLIDLLEKHRLIIGNAELDRRVATPGSWENIMFRAITDPSAEEMRIQEALGQLSSDERAGLDYRLRKEGKTILRTTSILETVKDGNSTPLTGDAAMLAFQCREKGGGYRIPLYNSGITIDVLTPTGNDIQTMISNCLIVDNQLGSSVGAHYFTYADLIYKVQIIEFINKLIVGSSYADWRSRGKLWSIIKLPDLNHLVITLAALCYKDGFDGFMSKCTRTDPSPCGHVETFTANLFEMARTRFPILNEKSIEFMVKARSGAKNTLAQIAQYQSDLGLESTRIVAGNSAFVMRIPTVSEHREAGMQFIADIINEIEGDNTDARYEQFGFRYPRTFSPWVAAVEAVDAEGNVQFSTADQKVITREIEKADDASEDGAFRDKLRNYINRSQLTYVGYPATPCKQCGHIADTPSGMITFDPFSAFFTLAFLYLTPKD